MRWLPVFAAIATVVLVAPASARDRTATLDDFGKVLDALRAAGCSAAQKVEVEKKGFEAEGVACGDKHFEIYLDEHFNITSKREERH